VSLGLVVSLLSGAFPLCPLCLVVNGLNLAAAVPVVRSGGRPFRDIARDWGRGLRYLGGASVGDPLAARWRVVGFACVGLAFVTIYQWILIEGDRAASRKKELDPAKVVASFEAAPRVEIPHDPDAPVLGSPGARVEIVVFSDAFCPHCRAFWGEARRMVERYGDVVRMVFRHFPLDPPCNKSVARPIHPHACNAGLALEVARREGKFWEFHDALPSPDMRGRKDPFLVAAEAAGIDAERFRADFKDAGLRARLEADVALGGKLGITATPAVFIDGRRVDDPSAKAVEILLAHLLGPRE
jgi:protein-disulfide isomerase